MKRTKPVVLVVNHYPSVETILDMALMETFEMVYSNTLYSPAIFLKQLQHYRPSVLIVDNGMGIEPHEVMGIVARSAVEVGCLYLDFTLCPVKISRFVKAGFKGYIYMGDRLDQYLKYAVSCVSRGEQFFSNSVMNVSHHFMDVTSQLTPQYRRVLSLMVQHHSPTEISEQLNVSVNTIYKWQSRLRRRFEVDSNSALLALFHVDHDATPSLWA